MYMSDSERTLFERHAWQANHLIPAFEGGEVRWVSDPNTHKDSARPHGQEWRNSELVEFLSGLLVKHLPGAFPHDIAPMLAMEEATTNVVRYGGPPPDEQIDHSLIRVEANIEHVFRESRRLVYVTLHFFDQGPDPKEHPNVYADRCIEESELQENHGRGFRLMREMGQFELDWERLSPKQKVIKLFREHIFS